jgi:hypothetical protein
MWQNLVHHEIVSRRQILKPLNVILRQHAIDRPRFKAVEPPLVQNFTSAYHLKAPKNMQKLEALRDAAARTNISFVLSSERPSKSFWKPTNRWTSATVGVRTWPFILANNIILAPDDERDASFWFGERCYMLCYDGQN